MTEAERTGDWQRVSRLRLRQRSLDREMETNDDAGVTPGKI
jgi:hypothetical protein